MKLNPEDPKSPKKGSRTYAWWYLTIGLGFLLLALRYYLLGGPLPPIILRGVISVGFITLAWLEFRSGRIR